MERSDGLTASLSRYLLAVATVGPVVAVIVAVIFPFPATDRVLLAAAVLTGLAAVAHCHEFWLTHRTLINVTTAAYVAMILVLPPALPGVLAAIAILIGQLRLRRDRLETVFNVGQVALSVTAAAVALAATRGLPLGPAIDRLGGEPFGTSGSVSLGALALAVAVLHVGNTALVAGAAGLQEGVSPLRLWWRTLADDLPAHLVLAALGVVAAFLTVDHIFVVPLLALPVVLVHHALREMVRLRADTQAALAALVDIVELRDPDTAGHSRRVAATARAVALRLGLTIEEADAIWNAGHVHDVGKVGIDLAILRKPGRLDESEWAEMRRHPGLGADIVGRVGAYGEGHRWVRHHHEAWDGSGYPDGLAGADIPRAARILAVADAFDALTSERPYRPSLSVEQAAAVLAAGAGRQWDSVAVAALLAELRVAECLPQPAAPEGPLHPAAAVQGPRAADAGAGTANGLVAAGEPAVTPPPSSSSPGGDRCGDRGRRGATVRRDDRAVGGPGSGDHAADAPRPQPSPPPSSTDLRESAPFGA